MLVEVERVAIVRDTIGPDSVSIAIKGLSSNVFLTTMLAGTDPIEFAKQWFPDALITFLDVNDSVPEVKVIQQAK